MVPGSLGQALLAAVRSFGDLWGHSKGQSWEAKMGEKLGRMQERFKGVQEGALFRVKKRERDLGETGTASKTNIQVEDSWGWCDGAQLDSGVVEIELESTSSGDFATTQMTCAEWSGSQGPYSLCFDEKADPVDLLAIKNSECASCRPEENTNLRYVGENETGGGLFHLPKDVLKELFLRSADERMPVRVRRIGDYVLAGETPVGTGFIELAYGGRLPGRNRHEKILSTFGRGGRLKADNSKSIIAPLASIDNRELPDSASAFMQEQQSEAQHLHSEPNSLQADELKSGEQLSVSDALVSGKLLSESDDAPVWEKLSESDQLGKSVTGHGV